MAVLRGVFMALIGLLKPSGPKHSNQRGLSLEAFGPIVRRMSEIVLVLGAGASVHAGAPVMATFLETARLLAKGITKDPWKTHFGRVFDAIDNLQRVHSKAYFDIHNLEAVFTMLETARTIGKLPGFKTEQIPEVIDSFKSVITYTLDVSTQFAVIKDQNGPVQIQPSADYLRFVQLVKMLLDPESEIGGVSIITFNYDIALDFALHDAGLYPNYCLPKNEARNTAIKLLKLHGSLNWGRVRSGEDIFAYDQLKDYAKDVASNVINHTRAIFQVGMGVQKLIKKQRDIEVESAPVIVPPGFYKEEHHETLKDVWRAAAEELAEAEDIIVIGFSLPTTDTFFNHLYALGTEGASSIRKFWVLNPDSQGVVEARFRAMLGFGASSHYFPLKFDLAVNELALQYYGPRSGSGLRREFGEIPFFGPDGYAKRPIRSSQVRYSPVT